MDMRELDRRSFLRIGLGATAAASLTPSLLAQETVRAAKGRAVIVLFMEGGPSHIDTFDPKPGRDTNGPFKAIDTAVRGIHVCEHLPRVAAEMKDLSIIRSMTSKEGDHGRGQYVLHTGHVPEAATTHPGIGAYVSREKGTPGSALPNFITIQLRGRVPGPAFLANDHAPYAVERPGEPISNIRYSAGIDVLRFNERMHVLEDLEESFAGERGAGFVQKRRESYHKADQLMHTPQLRAFDLKDEDESLRDQYGRTPFGQGCLLARRLVERGVKYVEVGLGGWDTHADNFAKTQSLMETLDPGFGTLVRDLRVRGLLQETMVLWMGEFGRTPRINGQNGRDHWPQVFSMVAGGGGVEGGRIVGASDPQGFEIKDRPVTVEDCAATLYHCLGIDAKKQMVNEFGRPIRILNGGAPIRELL
jgi:hypothetical protein